MGAHRVAFATLRIALFRLVALAAFLSLLVVGTSDALTHGSRVGPVRYLVEGRARAVVIEGAITYAGASRPLRVVLEARSAGLDHDTWHRVSGRTIRVRDGINRFSLRWTTFPAGQPLEVRVDAIDHGQVVAHGQIRRVQGGDPGTVFYSGEGDAGAADVGDPLAALIGVSDGIIRLVQSYGVLNLGSRFDGLWTTPGTHCGHTAAVPSQSSVASEPITELAGFSLGRLGPIYFLIANPAWESQINYILLLDPGGMADMQGSCDTSVQPNVALAKWLGARSTNRLVIMAGPSTLKEGYAGLDTYYLKGLFPAEQKQVMICETPNMHDHLHYLVNDKGGFGWMVGAPPPSSCPGGQPRKGWPPASGPTQPAPTPGQPVPTQPNPTVPAAPAAALSQGPAAPEGFWYAISLSGFRPEHRCVDVLL